MVTPSFPSVHFGGPDRPHRVLRDLLQERIDAVPPGGWISWATYYFRDMRLAEDLAAAHRRGVQVRIVLEGSPRLDHANDDVVAYLRGALDARSLNVTAPGSRLLRKLHPHMHVKLYAFSHPEPVAFVGSFNPSGNEPEDPEVIAEIGDQDRGHNMLVGYRDPALVAGLTAKVEGMMRSRRLLRFMPSQNRAVRAKETEIWFFPRLRSNVIDREFRDFSRGHIRGAISHLKPGRLMNHLCTAARAGCVVELLVHDTERRVPEEAVRQAQDAGILIRRYVHPDRLPMHAKFLLIDGPRGKASYFGSFNFNPRSRYLNHELLVRSTDAGLFAAFRERFETIAAQCGGYS